MWSLYWLVTNPTVWVQRISFNFQIVKNGGGAIYCHLGVKSSPPPIHWRPADDVPSERQWGVDGRRSLCWLSAGRGAAPCSDGPRQHLPIRPPIGSKFRSPRTLPATDSEWAAARNVRYVLCRRSLLCCWVWSKKADGLEGIHASLRESLWWHKPAGNEWFAVSDFRAFHSGIFDGLQDLRFGFELHVV